MVCPDVFCDAEPLTNIQSGDSQFKMAPAKLEVA
jgi:hypothetical protein